MRRPPPRILVADRQDPRRSELEDFVVRRFAEAYGARLSSHYPLIAGLFDAEGAVLAAAGVRFAETETLFLERYLDAPIEMVVAEAFDRPAARDSVVEIGAFASTGPAWSLQLFGSLAAWLTAVCGRRFAVATLRPELARMLGRAGFGLNPVADADPSRLGPEAASWGSYYGGGPRVFAGEIGLPEGLSHLRRRLGQGLAARAGRWTAEAAS